MSSSSRRPRAYLVALAIFLLVGVLVGSGPAERSAQAADKNPCEPWPLCKINHLIFIVQENRSFDHYFGTYRSPSGDRVAGLPKRPDGRFATCIPDQPLGHCVRPYHSTNPYNVGGPHSAQASTIDVNGGRMDGFIRGALLNSRTGFCVTHWKDPSCSKLTGPAGQPDVMSYHNREELGSYWAYADYGALQDHMFSPVRSWSLPAHEFLVSGWSANCKDPHHANSCASALKAKRAYRYPWADISILLRKYGVSWNYVVGDVTDLGCTEHPCQNTHDKFTTPEGWMPLRWFASVIDNDQVGNVVHDSTFFDQLAVGNLADVTWFAPPAAWSEHPGHSAIPPGQRYVTQIVNAIGQSPFWADSAIFITWDDWGGFYDHVPPTKVDGLGYGIRVPGLMVSPYARTSFVDHQTLSFDAYLKLIEDRFTNGERLDPNTDGWPDPRPTVREDINALGDLTNEFDFNQSPRPGPVLRLPAEMPLGWPARWNFAYQPNLDN